jgi:uncharacterized protein YecE (DUF72 family)
MALLYAGTSGFAYPSWKPDFYPPKLPSKKFLEHYASRLNSTEINYTFRRLPSASTLESWVSATGSHFLFACKAHMRITHILKLKEAAEFTEVFFRAIDPLRSSRRLGPVLFQLPPGLKCDVSLLTEFLKSLPDDLRYAFEFRHSSWLNDEVYRVLADRKVSLCLAESEKLVVPAVVPADFVYSRLRKPDYTPEEREEISVKVRDLLAQGKEVFVYFKHEDTPEGAFHAQELLVKIRGDGQAALTS